MKDLKCKKTALVFSLILVGLLVLVGCCRQPYKPVKAFPAETPDNAKMTINFNERGEFFIADHEGEAVSTKPVPFTTLVKEADEKDPNWLAVLGSFTLFRIRENSSLWLCNKDFQCIEIPLSGKVNSAVFSINYDYERDRLFFGSADGREINVKELKSFASLIRDTDFREKYGIKTINTFTIYKLKGSIKLLQ